MLKNNEQEDAFLKKQTKEQVVVQRKERYVSSAADGKVLTNYLL